MNKKVIGIIIAVVVILVAIIGVIYLVNNDSLNKEDSNDTSKALGTIITTTDENEEENTNTNPSTEKSNKILITNQNCALQSRSYFRWINELLALALLPLNTANIHYESKMTEGSRLGVNHVNTCR